MPKKDEEEFTPVIPRAETVYTQTPSYFGIADELHGLKTVDRPQYFKDQEQKLKSKIEQKSHKNASSNKHHDSSSDTVGEEGTIHNP